MNKLAAMLTFLCLWLSSFGQTYSPELQQAAQSGDEIAQFELAVCYHHGYGVGVDKPKALYWALQAANNGVTDAQYNVGYYYENGEGTEVDAQQAYAWYKRAAEAGNPSGERALA